MNTKNNLDLFSKIVNFSIENPELSPDRVLIIDMSKKTFENVLSPSRMELIRTINKKNPKSVGELAYILKRPVESVSRDLKILSNYGILELVQVGKIKKPIIEKDMLMIPLTA